MPQPKMIGGLLLDKRPNCKFCYLQVENKAKKIKEIYK